MKRAWILNNCQYGFHARSILLESEIAKLVNKSFSGKKGYSDPTLDVGSSTLVLERPVETRNLILHNPSPEDAAQNPGEYIFPYCWFNENWNWDQLHNKCESSECLRWNPSIRINHRVKEKLRGNKLDHYWTLYIIPKAKFGSWYLSFGWDAMESPLNTSFLERIGIILNSLIKIAGLSSWVVLKKTDKPETWLLDIFPQTGDFLPNRPVLEIPIKSGSMQFRPVNFNDKIITNTGLNCTFNLSNVSFEMIDWLVKGVLEIMKPENDNIQELEFSPSKADFHLFRNWAEPRFGGPWVQKIFGWAAKTPSPDDIDGSLSDWTLLPVAHFKILGSWRIVTVVKEPGGWRFHVTGKYTKDSLKHRHIRDELARKAGMTSETLWEPQEVGQGWLGVPG